MVDAEIASVESQLLKDERRLLDLRRIRQHLESSEELERGRGQSLEQVYRFLGSTERALEVMREVEGDGGLAEQLKQVERELEEISERSDDALRSGREETIRRQMAGYIERFIRAMEIPGAAGLPVLDRRDLNLRFEEEGNKPDYLW